MDESLAEPYQSCTSPFLGFSVSPSVSQNFPNCFNVEIGHIPLRILRRHVNTSNFTLLIVKVGCTRLAFIKLKNLGKIEFEN